MSLSHILKFSSGLLLSTLSFSSVYAATDMDNTETEQASTAQAQPEAASSERDQAMAAEKQKLAEDPTKVVTQGGISYGGDKVSLSGSIGLGPVNKINASVDADGSEWRLGGSWLFDVGIVNVNFGKKEFEDDSTQNNYSIGTFMPLSYFGFTPWGTQIFAMAGYTYNDGEVACYSADQCGNSFNMDDPTGMTLVPSSSSSGYAGFFALKPLSEKWRLLAVAAGSAGSNDYSGFLTAMGVGYSITKRQSIAAYGFLQDNSYGRDEQLGISYKYQFN